MGKGGYKVKNKYIIAILDGMIMTILFNIFCTLYISNIAMNINPNWFYIAVAVISIISVILFYIAIKHSTKNMDIWLLLISICSFIVSALLSLLQKITIPIQVIETRELYAGDGFVIVIYFVVFVILTITLKLFALFFRRLVKFLIRKK